MKLNFSYFLVFLSLILTTGCRTMVFGVPESTWNTLSEQQKNQVIIDYNRREEIRAQNEPLESVIGAASSLLRNEQNIKEKKLSHHTPQSNGIGVNIPLQNKVRKNVQTHQIHDVGDNYAYHSQTTRKTVKQNSSSVSVGADPLKLVTGLLGY